MSKITTEVCKNALNERWQVQGKKSPADWKRLSKTGTAATAIVRVFQHRNLPFFGTVVEENGEITKVIFADSLIAAQLTVGSQPSAKSSRGTGRKGQGQGEVDAAGSVGDTTGGAIRTPGQPASNGRVSADQFLFAVCERDNRRTTFAICRRDFWHAHHYLSDTGFGDLLDGLLPPGTSVASECQYSNKMARKPLYEFLLAQGFGDDERFTSYMDGYQPGE